MTQKDSILDQVEQLEERIANRAYDLFLGRDGWGDSVGDCLSAEQELAWKPAVDLRERDGAFVVAAALPGFDAKDITVPIALKLASNALTSKRRKRTRCCAAGVERRQIAAHPTVGAPISHYC
jgi:HSP20 family molecular chaperone IbpA